MEGNARFRSGRRPQFRSFAPVKVGDELEVTIESVGEKGDGVAKKDGFVLFIPGVKQNDHVKIRVTKVLRKVGFAEVAGGASSDSDSEESSEEQQESEPSEAEEESSEEEAQDSEDSENFGEELEE